MLWLCKDALEPGTAVTVETYTTGSYGFNYEDMNQLWLGG